MSKLRRHHNNKGVRQIKRGKTYTQVARIARRLSIPLAIKLTKTKDEQYQ